MQANISETLAPDNGGVLYSTVFVLRPGETASYSVAYGAGATHQVTFQETTNPGAGGFWNTVAEELVLDGAEDDFSGTFKNTSNEDKFLRWRSKETDGGSTDESATVTIAAVLGDALAPSRFSTNGTLIEQFTDEGPLSNLGIGLHNAALTYKELGNGLYRRTDISLNTTLTFADEGGAGQYASLTLYTFPPKAGLLLGVQVSLVITLLAPFIDAAAGAWGIGSTAVDDGGDPATTEVDAFAATDFTASTKVITITAASSVVQAWRASEGALIFNIAVDDNAAHAAGGGHTIVGDISFFWAF